MRRRDFIVVLGAVVAWPLAARAQRPGGLRKIGFLGASNPSSARQWVAAFVGRLRELGWNEGQNLAIEYRWAEGRSENVAEIAAEYVRLNVDAIVTYGTPTAIALKQAVSTVPIVFALASEPVGSGLVASIARPGRNVTGLSTQSSDLASKRIELLREVVPGFRRLAVMIDAANVNDLLERREIEAAVQSSNIAVVRSEIRRSEDVAPAFAALKGRADVLYVPPNPLMGVNMRRIDALALDAHLPTMFGAREYVEAGALMSYGPSFPEMFRRSADFIDKILRGTKPGDIPVEQPTKFELVVNLKTAKALGLKIPEAFLLRADEVIE